MIRTEIIQKLLKQSKNSPKMKNSIDEKSHLKITQKMFFHVLFYLKKKKSMQFNINFMTEEF